MYVLNPMVHLQEGGCTYSYGMAHFTWHLHKQSSRCKSAFDTVSVTRCEDFELRKSLCKADTTFCAICSNNRRLFWLIFLPLLTSSLFHFMSNVIDRFYYYFWVPQGKFSCNVLRSVIIPSCTWLIIYLSQSECTLLLVDDIYTS